MSADARRLGKVARQGTQASQMITVQIEVDGTTYEGHAAITSDGSLRVISRHGSRNVPVESIPLPLAIQAEMTLAEMVAQLHPGPATLIENASAEPGPLSPSLPVEGPAVQQPADHQSGPRRSWLWPTLPRAAQGRA